MSILLLSAGRRVDLLRAIESSVNDLLPKSSHVLAADFSPNRSAACSLAYAAFKLPKVTDPGYLPALRSLCKQQNVRLVIPTIDTELLPLARESNNLVEDGISIVVSDLELIKQCRDKRLTASLFSSIGIESPAILNPKSLHFPCFLKPISGSCSQGARCIPSQMHLSAADVDDPNNIFQDFVPSTWQEYTVDVLFSKTGRLISMVPRERLETRGGEISKGVTRHGVVMNLLKPALERLQGARGCLTVQVFLSPEQNRLLGVEINPRFGGGYPLSHAAGAGFPEMIIREWLLGELPSWCDNWKGDQMMLRYDSMVISSLD